MNNVLLVYVVGMVVGFFVAVVIGFILSKRELEKEEREPNKMIFNAAIVKGYDKKIHALEQNHPLIRVDKNYKELKAFVENFIDLVKIHEKTKKEE